MPHNMNQNAVCSEPKPEFSSNILDGVDITNGSS